MSIQRMTPSSTAEILDYFNQLRNGPEYISSIGLNQATARIEIRFNHGPNIISYPDTYVPIKKERLAEVARLIKKGLARAAKGAAPGKEDIQAFFEMVEGR